MPSLPGEFAYGTVTGRILTAVKDTDVDPDTHPDSVSATGYVVFTPSVETLVARVSKNVVIVKPVTVDLDADGSFTVDLVATNNPDLTPSNFSYQMDVVVNFGQVPSQVILVPAGTTTDIASLYR